MSHSCVRVGCRQRSLFSAGRCGRIQTIPARKASSCRSFTDLRGTCYCCGSRDHTTTPLLHEERRPSTLCIENSSDFSLYPQAWLYGGGSVRAGLDFTESRDMPRPRPLLATAIFLLTKIYLRYWLWYVYKRSNIFAVIFKWTAPQGKAQRFLFFRSSQDNSSTSCNASTQQALYNLRPEM